MTLGAPIALDALKAMEQSSSTAKLVTFDLNADAAQAIKDGKIQFSIDQQPYVQGYMAVTSLYLNIKNGNDIGGGRAVLTGPSFVDSNNIDVILPFTEEQHPLVGPPGTARGSSSSVRAVFGIHQLIGVRCESDNPDAGADGCAGGGLEPGEARFVESVAGAAPRWGRRSRRSCFSCSS